MNLDNQHPMEDFSDEASMAKADLYKAGKYSLKLIKMIQDGQELPAWVQAKITKAADYIASVYHFMEFDIKKSDFADHIENADMYAEHLQSKYQEKLMEAKLNLKKAKVKKPKVPKPAAEKQCSEDCSQCEESCDSRLDEGPYLGQKYVDLHHPKYGKLELISLGNFMMIVGEPNSKFDDVKGDPKIVRDAWKKLIHDAKIEKARMGGYEVMGTGPLKRASESINEKVKAPKRKKAKEVNAPSPVITAATAQAKKSVVKKGS